MSEFGQQGSGSGDEVVGEGAIVKVETTKVRGKGRGGRGGKGRGKRRKGEAIDNQAFGEGGFADAGNADDGEDAEGGMEFLGEGGNEGVATNPGGGVVGGEGWGGERWRRGGGGSGGGKGGKGGRRGRGRGKGGGFERGDEGAEVLSDMEEGLVGVLPEGDGGLVMGERLEGAEGGVLPVYGAEDDGDNASFFGVVTCHCLFDDVPEVIGGEEVGADEEQDEVGGVESIARFTGAIAPGGDLAIAPVGDDSFAFEQAEVLAQFIAPGFVLGGVGDEDFDGGGRRLRHGG